MTNFSHLFFINKTSTSFNSSAWIYTIMILYSFLAILFLTALIVPSTLVYLLVRRSCKWILNIALSNQNESFIHSIYCIIARTEPTQLSTYTKHCGGISSNTLWQINSTTTITMIINTTQCNFPNTPLYFVSILGLGNQFCLLGYGAIYLPTRESFQIYTRYGCSSTVNSTWLLSLAQSSAYNISWAGFYR